MSTHSLRRSWFRAVAFVLVPVHVAMSAPAFAEVALSEADAKAAAAASKPALPPEVKVNRTVPKVAPPPLYPVFSKAPTAAEITRARVFGEPLLVVGGPPSHEENAALAAAISRWLRTGDPEDTSVFEHFLEVHPASPWRASLAANLGVVYDKHGYFARADAKFREAWATTKDLETPEATAVAEQSIAELLSMGMKFGKVEKLEELLADVGERNTGGKAFELIKAAHSSAWELRHDHHKAIPSGPVALDRILTRVNPGERRPQKISEFHATEEGASLAQIERLALDVDLPLRTGFRPFGGEIVVPAVIHLKAGHFSALVREENGRYLLDDPLLGGEVWMSKGALEEESSGFFLIPDGPLPEGWRAANATELASVRGKCQSVWGDPECDCFGNWTCPSGRCAPFMAQYRFVEHLASLLIQDSPVGYNPPRGPASFLQLTYHQRQVLQPTTFTFSNAGGSWSIGWVAWIEDNPANLLTTIRTHLGNAGAETSFGLQGSTFSPASRSRAILVRTSTSPIRYERRLPDGSVEVFAQPDGAATFPRRVMMTQTIDPQGNALSFTYDSQLRLVAVADAIGQVSTLSYDLVSDPLKVTRVSDPFGRTAKLEYNSAGRLVRVVDVIGMESSFEYGYGAFVRSMTTPYGTTSFASAQYADIYNHPLQHWIQATDPMGAIERMEYHYSSAAFPATEPASAVPTGFATMNAALNAHATFYWDKRAWMLHPGDYTKARTIKWLNGETWKIVDSKHSEKLPLENRVWYGYEGNPADGWVGPLHQRAAKIARVLDDGATRIDRYEYGPRGNHTRSIDPLGRETVYEYDLANDIDLLRIKQKNGAGYDLIETRTYNSQHLPLTVTDAAGQTTNYTYNVPGQLATITTPQRAGITENRTTSYAYDTNGDLQSVAFPASGATKSFTYDGYGRIRTTTSFEGYTVTYDYDMLDRPTRATYPDGTYEQTVYNRLDPQDQRDRLGVWSHTLYDELRRPVTLHDSIGRTSTLQWCACGSLDKVVDGNQNATSWERDIQGRITSEIRPDGTSLQVDYENATSRVMQESDPKSQVVGYKYFLDDNVKQITYTNTAVTTPTVSVTYDPIYNRPATMSDGTGTTTYTFNPISGTPALGAGLLASVDGPLANDTVSSTYDELGRPASRTLSGVTTTWSYDTLGRVSGEANGLGSFAYGFDGNTQRLSTVSYPNGQHAAFTYLDNLGDRRLARIRNTLPGGGILSQFDYLYDSGGKITKWTQQKDGGSPTAYALDYDTAYQLTKATIQTTQSTPAILRSYAYAYDNAGNRTAEQIDGVVRGTIFNSLNQLLTSAPSGALAVRGTTNEPATVTIQGAPAQTTSANGFHASTPVSPGNPTFTATATDPSGNTRTNTYEASVDGTAQNFSYDLNGNLTSDGSRTFEWNGADQLVAVNVGNQRSEYTYDGTGRVVRLIDKTNGITDVDRRFLWCDDAVCEEREASGATVVRRYYAGGMREGAFSFYYTQDHLLSVRELTDDTAAVRARYDYDPYGRVTKVSGDKDSSFTFTGHLFHSTRQLVLAPLRAYDPGLGRWLNEDPIGFAAGLNKYAYVGGNPINMIDPFGQDGAAATAGAAQAVPLPQVPKQPGQVIRGPWAPPGGGAASSAAAAAATAVVAGAAMVLMTPKGLGETPDEEPWQGPSYDPQQCKKRPRSCTCWASCSVIQMGQGVPSNVSFPQHTSAFGSGPDCVIAGTTAINNAQEVLRQWILRNPWFQGRIKVRHCRTRCPN